MHLTTELMQSGYSEKSSCYVTWIMRMPIATIFLLQIIAIRDIIRPPNRDQFKDVYIVYELMDTDLHQIIRSNQLLTEDHCQVVSSWRYYIENPCFQEGIMYNS